jgi:hypothetical protein
MPVIVSGCSKIFILHLAYDRYTISLLRLEEERNRILARLNGKNQSKIIGDVLHEREDGTGSWFLDGHDFKDWRSEPAFLILLSGSGMLFTKAPSQAVSADCLIFGSGKTVWCPSIIAQLRQETISAADDRPCGSLAYFYCSFQVESTKEVRTLLKSLLRQLCPTGGLPLSL